MKNVAQFPAASSITADLKTMSFKTMGYKTQYSQPAGFKVAGIGIGKGAGLMSNATIAKEDETIYAI